MAEKLELNSEFFDKERLVSFVFEKRWIISAALLGLVLLGVGLFLLRSGIFEGAKIEVIEKEGEEEAQGEIIVEIAGAVQNPGVYKLLASTRVERLLIAAGGLSAEADREWVAKNLNRAAKLVDGQKIYVPALGESVKGTTSITGTTGSEGRININTATVAELDTLWGIGPARASAIIDGRPYSSIEELLTRKIIPSNVYERIKDEVTAP